jgi:hypothetical protein
VLHSITGCHVYLIFKLADFLDLCYILDFLCHNVTLCHSVTHLMVSHLCHVSHMSHMSLPRVIGHQKCLGAGYTSDFVCDFMSDLLQIAYAIWCICDLVSHTELLPFTRSMRYGVAICCANRHGHGIAPQVADTQNRICDLVQKKR